MPGQDYAAGCYFVTVCTQQRRHFFGEIVDGEMQVSPIGDIVAEEWMRTAYVRSYVTLDAWVVMPNHIHGIMILDPPTAAVVETARRAVSIGSPPTDAIRPSVLRPHSLGRSLGNSNPSPPNASGPPDGAISAGKPVSTITLFAINGRLIAFGATSPTTRVVGIWTMKMMNSCTCNRAATCVALNVAKLLEGVAV